MHPTGSVFIALGGVCVVAAAAFLGLRLWSSSAAVSTDDPEPLLISAASVGPGSAGRMVTVEGRLAEIDLRQPGLRYLLVEDETGRVEVPYLDSGTDERVFKVGAFYRVTGLVVADESGATLVPRSSEGVVALGTTDAFGTKAEDPELEHGRPTLSFAETPPGMFSVAVASPASLQEARRIARPYHEAGYEVGIAPVSVETGRHYRVLLGPYVDRANAEVVVGMVRSTVPDAWIVEH